MRHYICTSGLKGWEAKLHAVYSSFEKFEAYSGTYGLHSRLGYCSPEAAWKANPRVHGSVNPSDYGRSKR